MTLDTLKMARKLREAGFSTEQAESLVEALMASQGSTATKHDIELVQRDIDGLRHELKSDIGAVRHELSGDLDAVRQELKGDFRLALRMLGVLVAANVAILLRVYA